MSVYGGGTPLVPSRVKSLTRGGARVAGLYIGGQPVVKVYVPVTGVRLVNAATRAELAAIEYVPRGKAIDLEAVFVPGHADTPRIAGWTCAKGSLTNKTDRAARWTPPATTGQCLLTATSADGPWASVMFMVV